MYLDDPSDLIEPIEAVWPEYRSDGPAIVEHARSATIVTRIGSDDYIPKHPFWKTVDTRSEGSSWSPRPIRWIDDSQKVDHPAEHSFDADGRLLLMLRPWVGSAIIYGEGFHDIVFLRRNADFPDWSACADPYTGRPNPDGVSGNLTRVFTDGNRITALAKIQNEGDSLNEQYRSTEIFHYEGSRLTESFFQSYVLDNAIPLWAKDLPAEQQANMYKPVSGRFEDRLWESRRSRNAYSYNDAGILVGADKFGESGDHRETIYAIDPKDTIENVSDALVKTLVPAVTKAIKAVKQARPVRRVALQYSAEHTHCGLPTGVLLSGEHDGVINPVDWEAYKHEAEWPPAGRTGSKIESLLLRLTNVVECHPDYADDFQPRPYREVLWRVCREVGAKLKPGRNFSADIAVFPIDDHGDVDPLEDVRESMPAEQADGVLTETRA